MQQSFKRIHAFKQKEDISFILVLLVSCNLAIVERNIAILHSNITGYLYIKF